MKGTILPTKSAGSTFPFGHKTVRAQVAQQRNGDTKSAAGTMKGTGVGKLVPASHTAKGTPVVKAYKSKLA